jgi:hypothetical protein
MWCELPKVYFCKPHVNTEAKAVPRLLTLYMACCAMYRVNLQRSIERPLFAQA